MTSLTRNFPVGILLFLSVLTASGQAAETPSESGPARLVDLIETALENNPDLQAAENRWRMFEHKILPAGSLDDPTLSFSLTNYPIDSLEAGETPMTGNDLRVSQKFPFPGKLAVKEKMAEEQARWYEGAYRDARLQVTRQVKETWYRLFFHDRAIEVTRRNLDLLDDFIRLTETRYEVGQGLQQDVLKAQVERSKLMDRLFNLQQQRETLQANLNTLLARPSDTPIETPSDLSPTEVELELEELQEASRDHRPLYASYASLVDRFRAQRKAAKLDYRPDFSLWAGYRFREDTPGDPVDGTDFVSGGISVNLPIWQRKRSEAVAEAESGIRMALRQFEDFQNRVYFNTHDAYARMKKDRDLVALYKTGIVPQANQTFQSTLSAYQVGSVDFLSLLDSLMKLYDFETEYYRVLADHERDVARLESVTGVELSRPASSQADMEPVK